jgi:hypothetical protein
VSSVAFDAADAAQPLNDEARAVALWTFVHLKTPSFASKDALQIVHELDPQIGEDPKSLAKRLRRALASRGVALKHTHALDAASRLLGMASWHAGGHQSVHRPLQLRCHFAGFDGPLSTWSEAIKVFGDYCEGEISAGGMCVYQFEFGPNSVSMDLPFTTAQDSTGRTEPLLQVLWETGDHKQLQLAVAAVEGLRRRLEESSRAVVDGLAATQFCLQTPHPEPTFEDPLNSELVVVDVAPGPSYLEEIARGDEVKCWAELDELFEGADYTATGSNWVTPRHQLQWSLSTLRTSGPAPMLVTRTLTPEETGRLLRRYRNAVRAGRKFLPQDRVKRLESLRVETLGVDVDWERVSLEMARTHLNWQQFLETLGVRGRPSRLSTTEFSKLVALLDGPSPRELIRTPKRLELVRLDDDSVLRALVSRVQDVVYEVPRRMDERLVKAVDDAVNMFLTALRMDVETTDGLNFQGFPRSGPYLIYANQGKELLQELTKHGLVAYAGLTTRVESLRVGEYRTAKSKPLRFDRVLLLDIEYAQLVGPQKGENSFSVPLNGGEEDSK